MENAINLEENKNYEFKKQLLFWILTFCIVIILIAPFFILESNHYNNSFSVSRFLKLMLAAITGLVGGGLAASGTSLITSALTTQTVINSAIPISVGILSTTAITIGTANYISPNSNEASKSFSQIIEKSKLNIQLEEQQRFKEFTEIRGLNNESKKNTTENLAVIKNVDKTDKGEKNEVTSNQSLTNNDNSKPLEESKKTLADSNNKNISNEKIEPLKNNNSIEEKNEVVKTNIVSLKSEGYNARINFQDLNATLNKVNLNTFELAQDARKSDFIWGNNSQYLAMLSNTNISLSKKEFIKTLSFGIKYVKIVDLEDEINESKQTSIKFLKAIVKENSGFRIEYFGYYQEKNSDMMFRVFKIFSPKKFLNLNAALSDQELNFIK